MENQTNEEICRLITPLLSQKQQAGYYNIPPPRLNIVSPYPFFSNQQLNMRRKVEILKYSNSQQNTKTNNFTKRQHFANLVRNAGISSTKVSQYSINQQSNLECISDKYKPTLTTACDVPGPPMILQYDPSIPLYNYGNFKNNRSGAIINPTLDAVYESYTQNIVEIVSGNFYSLIPDKIIQSDTANYTYTGTLGTLMIRNSVAENTYSFNISTPIAIWFNSSIKSIQYTGTSFNNKQSLTDNDVFLTIHIQSIQVLVYYNDTIINQVTVMNDSNSSIFVDTICNLKSASSLFYAIQYVGMLRINNLTLKVPSQTAYTLKYVVNYSYNSKTVDTYLDFIQTSVYANLESAFQEEYLHNCKVTTSMEPVRFESNAFTQFPIS
jgi:hypothetical protein